MSCTHRIGIATQEWVMEANDTLGIDALTPPDKETIPDLFDLYLRRYHPKLRDWLDDNKIDFSARFVSWAEVRLYHIGLSFNNAEDETVFKLKFPSWPFRRD